MKGWKKFSKAISDSQSSIPEKRKGGENFLKGLVNEITDGVAYPEKGSVTEDSTEVMVASTTETEEVVEVKEDQVIVASATMTEEEMIQTDIPLNVAMLTYIAINKLDIPPIVTTAIANATSSTEVVEELVPLGNPTLNAQMLHWTMHNSGSDHTPEELKSVVFAHLAEHSDHHKALSGLLSETDIDALAHGLALSI